MEYLLLVVSAMFVFLISIKIKESPYHVDNGQPLNVYIKQNNNLIATYTSNVIDNNNVVIIFHWLGTKR